MRIMPRELWVEQRRLYSERVRPWIADRILRTSRSEKHPVHDFLFEYYSFRPAHLERWTPGFDIVLERAIPSDVSWSEFLVSDRGAVLPASSFPSQRASYLHWAQSYLEAVAQREPAFNCSGLHEWAMLYFEPAIRHSGTPLRLSPDAIHTLVESFPLRCSHYDAYRFFSTAAVPRNRWALSRVTTIDNDQPGCVHVNMDLYRFAYKIVPYCPSEVVAEAFELAAVARAIDMRASPYDLRALGFEPIPIETTDGRQQYVELQRELYANGQPIRRKLLQVYRTLIDHQNTSK